MKAGVAAEKEGEGPALYWKSSGPMKGLYIFDGEEWEYLGSE